MTRPLARRAGRTPRATTGLALILALAAAALLLAGTGPASAQMPSLDQFIPAGDGSTSGRIIQMLGLLTVLSVAPGLLIMTTSFTRFIIAFSFLRSGLGLQTTPANLVLVSLSLFMTFYVMGPTLDRAWQNGLRPLTAGEITEQEAVERIADPFRDFMLSQVRDKDLRLFSDMNDALKTPGTRDGKSSATAPAPSPAPPEKVEMRVLIPAFMISELRRGFEIGFLIVLPFLIIDMVVATLVMSMGMMMMPPAVIALPFKILFFILIDGWNLLVSGLVRSFL